MCIYYIIRKDESLFSALYAIFLFYAELVLMKFTSTQMKRLSQWHLLILRGTPSHLKLEFTIFTNPEALAKYLQEVRNIAPENPCRGEGYLNPQVLWEKKSTDHNFGNQDIPVLPVTSGPGSAPAHEPTEVSLS